MKNLLKLNVSNNKLSKMIDFLPSEFLEEIIMENNNIEEISDCCEMKYLKKLNLKGN